MSLPRANRYLPGAEEKRPTNIGTYDAVLCGQLILMAGPNIRERCMKPMTIMKVIDSGLQIRPKTLQCDAWGGHIIPTQQMYIGVCSDPQHVNGKSHVVCRVCIENYHHFGPYLTPNFSIIQDYYEYKYKKKHSKSKRTN